MQLSAQVDELGFEIHSAGRQTDDRRNYPVVKVVTIFANAAPRMTAIARSRTLPRAIKALKSLHIDQASNSLYLGGSIRQVAVQKKKAAI